MLNLSPPSAGLLSDVSQIVGAQSVSYADVDRWSYARDLWPRQQIKVQAGNVAPAPPALIVWPSSLEEISALVRFAAARKIPLVPFGAGSGVCGAVRPSADAIIVDMKRMREVTNLDEKYLLCSAQSGILGQHLEDRLNERSFTMGHFPSSIYCSTLGGWLAGRSAGQCSGRYGKIEDIVTGLSFVDGQGTIYKCERSNEHAALIPLLIGSEGILGVIADATFNIAPFPVHRVFSSWLAPSVEAGLHAIQRIYQSGLRPAVARLYDPFDTMISNTLKGHGHNSKRPEDQEEHSFGPNLSHKALVKLLRAPALLNRTIHALPKRLIGGAKLIFVWESDGAIGRAEAEEAARICRELGARDTGEDPARHWLSRRHSVSYRQSPIFAAGGFVDTMEVAATWSRLMPMYHAVRKALSAHVFVMAHFSHAYPDGASIYFTMAGSARGESDALAKYDTAWRNALNAAISAGGTLSHHHGVGRSKAPAMAAEQGAALQVVRALKKTFDPSNILNPGALLPS